MSVEVVHLRYLVAAAEHRSFRRAAMALNVTQPTLSKRVRELEDRLGMPLFERSAGGAHLTSDGEDFVLGAKRILLELEGMEQRARAGKAGETGRLQIGFYTSLSTGTLSDVICGFAEQHREVDIDLIEKSRSSLFHLLDRGAIDLVIVLGVPRFLRTRSSTKRRHD